MSIRTSEDVTDAVTICCKASRSLFVNEASARNGTVIAEKRTAATRESTPGLVSHDLGGAARRMLLLMMTMRMGAQASCTLQPQKEK